MGRLSDGSVVAVVGASGGLGAQFVAQPRASGARILLGGPHPDRLAPLCETNDVVVPLDLRDSDHGEALVAAAQVIGRLDGVVSAAGIVAFGPPQPHRPRRVSTA